VDLSWSRWWFTRRRGLLLTLPVAAAGINSGFAQVALVADRRRGLLLTLPPGQ
jgi:hypothetical protein